MRAWAVDSRDRWGRRPAGRGPSGPCPSPVRARCGSGSRRAACAAPTCTWPRATCAPRRPATCPATRSSGVVDALGAGRDPVRARATGSASPGCARTCGRCRCCRARPGEPLPGRRASPAGTPTAATPSCAVVPEAFAYRLPDGARRRRRRAAAVRRDHRLPRAAAGRAAAGRPARHLRLRRVRPPRRAGRDRPGGDGARAHPVRRGPGAGARARAPRRRARPTTRRPSRSTRAILFAPAGELVPVALRGARPGRHARRRRHPPQRHPAAGLRSADLFQERQLRSVTANTRADGEEFLRAGGRAARPADGHGRTRSTRPTGRCATSPRTGSPAPPC